MSKENKKNKQSDVYENTKKATHNYTRSAYKVDFLFDEARFNFPTVSNDSSNDVLTPICTSSIIFEKRFSTRTTRSEGFTLTVAKISVKRHRKSKSV